MSTNARHLLLALLLSLGFSLIAGAATRTARTGDIAAERQPPTGSPLQWAARQCRDHLPAHGPGPDLCQVAFGSP
jgi:hypothetical protein